MRPVAAAALLLAALVAAAQSNPSDPLLEAPDLRPGDVWTYRTNTSLAAGFFMDGQVSVNLVARETEDVGGVSLDVYRMSVRGSGVVSGSFTTELGTAPASGQWVITGEELVEPAGLKVVVRLVDLQANGTIRTTPVALAFRLSVQNTTTYRIEEDGWRLPVRVGDWGTVRSLANFSADTRISFGLPGTPVHSEGVAWWNASYEVLSYGTVDVPAGSFDAFRIREERGDGITVVHFFAPRAGNDVRTESYNGTEPIGSAELVSYRYQALEPPRFLGLTQEEWTSVGVAAAAIALGAGALLLRRRRAGPRRPRSLG